MLKVRNEMRARGIDMKRSGGNNSKNRITALEICVKNIYMLSIVFG